MGKRGERIIGWKAIVSSLLRLPSDAPLSSAEIWRVKKFLYRQGIHFPHVESSGEVYTTRAAVIAIRQAFYSRLVGT